MKEQHKCVLVCCVLCILAVVLTTGIVYIRMETNYSIIVTVDDLRSVADSSNLGLLKIDLRDEEDYEAGHIEGFINIPSKNGDEVKEYIQAHNGISKRIVLLCYSGKRSSTVFNALYQEKYKKISCCFIGYDEYAGAVEGFVPETGPCKCKDENLID